jgi:molybdopterin converting factor small subunit
MKYHVLPIPEQLFSEELKNAALRKSYNKLKKEMSKSLVKLRRKERDSHYKDILYLYNDRNMNLLINKLKKGDEIVVHGEGNPFVIGLEEPSQYDLSAIKLAEKLEKNKLPDIAININLLTCNSASEYKNSGYKHSEYEKFNFAQNCSEALNIFFKYENILITGYTSMIKVNSNAKYTVSSANDRDSKGTHASLEDASMVYKNGKLVKEGRILSDLSKEDFSFAQSYIKAANSKKSEMMAKAEKSKKNDIQSQNKGRKQSGSLTFFSQCTSNQCLQGGPDNFVGQINPLPVVC